MRRCIVQGSWSSSHEDHPDAPGWRNTLQQTQLIGRFCGLERGGGKKGAAGSGPGPGPGLGPGSGPGQGPGPRPSQGYSEGFLVSSPSAPGGSSPCPSDGPAHSCLQCELSRSRMSMEWLMSRASQARPKKIQEAMRTLYHSG